MHRVELKVVGSLVQTPLQTLFLMHRVELKVLVLISSLLQLSPVPNAPCGVESVSSRLVNGAVRSSFLMHRVELKVHQELREEFSPDVPNAPCGVESFRGHF